MLLYFMSGQWNKSGFRLRAENGWLEVSYKGRTVRERAEGQYKILRVIWVV